MNRHDDLQIRLRGHLAERSYGSMPHGQLDRILAITSTASQRGRWHATAHATARGVRPALSLASRRTVLLFVATVLVGLLAVAILGFGHAQPRTPFNGLILIGRFEAAVGDTVVYTIRPDGTGLRQLSPEPAEEPHWSPDGQRILLGDRIVTPDGVVLERWQLDNGTFHIQCPYWSPDASRLLCEGFDDNVVADAERHGVYTVRASDRGDLRRLTAPGVFGSVAGYSPDGRSALFLDADLSTGSGPVYLIDVDGTNLRRLGTLDANAVSWAPDGRSVLAGSGGSLFRVDISTGAATRVTIPTVPSAQVISGVWSPDQTQILFKQLTDQFDLYVMDADGSAVRQLTSDQNDERFFDWGTHPLEP